MQLSLTTMELRNNKLQRELAEQSHDQSHGPKPKSHDQPHEYEEQIEKLQVELEKKTSMLMEVKRHLHEAAEREKQLKSLSADPQLSEKCKALVKENEQLQQQVAQVIISRKFVRDKSHTNDVQDFPMYLYNLTRSSVSKLNDQSNTYPHT